MESTGTGSNRPRLFIGSSGEGKRLAEAIQLNMDGEIESEVWSQGGLGLGETPIESLDRVSLEFDFAALVVTPDDIVESRGARRLTPRDNVLFEAGLFMGRLGRDRTFLVCPRDQGVRLPSDLAGMTLAQYTSASNGNLQAALGPACTRIKTAITRMAGRSRTAHWSPAPAAADPSGYVPRPRRRSSLGTASPHGPKMDLRIVNISVTGALLESSGEMPIGQVLDLDLRLDDGALVSVTARVVRVQYPDWGRIGGVGVAFTSVPEASAAALAAFVETNHPVL